MILLALVLAGQVAAPEPQRWSILNDPCPRGSGDEIIVCAPEATPPRLPLPEERPPPDVPRQPINEPRAALENSGRPCPPGGCTGISLPLIPIAVRVVEELGHALKRKHPGKREPIVLD